MSGRIPRRSHALLKVATVTAALGALPATGGVALAQQSPESTAAVAESLFQDGRKMMEGKRYAAACPKFLASYKLAPAPGTLLNLADCYEKNGQLASAWARFHEAIALAQRTGRPDREKVARDRADKLEPRLLRLTIVTKEPGVEVTLDGAVLDPSAIATPLPVDPGRHTVEAKASGKAPFSTTVEIGERTKASSVEIPELDDAPPEAAPGQHETRDVEAAPPGEGASRGKTQRTVGIVMAAVGGAGLVVGTVFGLRTSSKWSEAKPHCTYQDCDAEGVALAGDAKTSGNISTASFIAAGALLAGGAALWLTAPKPASTSGIREVKAAVGPGSVVIGGRF